MKNRRFHYLVCFVVAVLGVTLCRTPFLDRGFAQDTYQRDREQRDDLDFDHGAASATSADLTACDETVLSEYVDEPQAGAQEQITVEQDEQDDWPSPTGQTRDPFLNHSKIVFSSSSAFSVEGRTNKVSKNSLPLFIIVDKSAHSNGCFFFPCGETGLLYSTIRPHLLFRHLLI